MGVNDLGAVCPSDIGFLHRPYTGPNFSKGDVDYLRRTLEVAP